MADTLGDIIAHRSGTAPQGAAAAPASAATNTNANSSGADHAGGIGDNNLQRVAETGDGATFASAAPHVEANGGGPAPAKASRPSAFGGAAAAGQLPPLPPAGAGGGDGGPAPALASAASMARAQSLARQYSAARRVTGGIYDRIRTFLETKRPGQVDLPEVLQVKGLIRLGEARAACRFARAHTRGV
ncbi:hypothetical protein MNEG_8411 [Monoraphidium neglectum]|uniref:Uncharacterized protein n=1 Tax=Monoraphidium neglectum TaxID=145388 RepID=A0A0D2JJT0_9CHLO|nr:hypothetical protein MNEG_8411 [Monoraphidium neglectum]KIY99547.1 hypothetical protein MNEG_8411 [Monoraphidium neglectum]|eukprot:XP_013898567.1 hypothetical protein MNEG_8411 [Monoraphidium neglectum]